MREFGIKKIAAIAMVLVALLAWPEAARADAAADFNRGLEAAENGDDALAVKWYRKAAEQGDAGAQNNLGVVYELGQGVPQDHKTAVKWYRKAAEQGHAEAQYNLGVMYRGGRGVARDWKQAAKWYRKAAEQGHAMAQFLLGEMYKFGKGVVKNPREAYFWFLLSAAGGNEVASNILSALETDLTPAQITEVQARAAQWQAKEE